MQVRKLFGEGDKREKQALRYKQPPAEGRRQRQGHTSQACVRGRGSKTQPRNNRGSEHRLGNIFQIRKRKRENGIPTSLQRVVWEHKRDNCHNQTVTCPRPCPRGTWEPVSSHAFLGTLKKAPLNCPHTDTTGFLCSRPDPIGIAEQGPSIGLSCMCSCLCERETDRQIDTDKHRDRDTEKQRARERRM